MDKASTMGWQELDSTGSGYCQTIDTPLVTQQLRSRMSAMSRILHKSDSCIHTYSQLYKHTHKKESS